MLSDEILVTLDANLLPDLEVLESEIYVFPLAPIVGEETTIVTGVKNNSFIDAENVDLEIYIWNGQTLDLLKATTLPFLYAGQEEYIYLSWDSSGYEGVNNLLVYVDVGDKILESSEANNIASKPFLVAGVEGVDLSAELNHDQFTSNDYLNIDIGINNSGSAKQLILAAQIEDANGLLVEEIDSDEINLAYGAIEEYLLAWGTGATYAGGYQAVISLKDLEGNMLAEQILPFTILPDLDVEADLTTDKLHYGPNENVKLATTVSNNGVNYHLSELTLQMRITANNVQHYSSTEIINYLWAGTSATSNFTWNTGLVQPGEYTADVEAYFEGNLVATSTKVFIVDPVTYLSGTVVADPKAVLLGNAGAANYSVSCTGNLPVNDLPVEIVLFDTLTQSIVNTFTNTMNIGINESHAATVSFASGLLNIRTYKVLLYVGGQADKEYLAADNFSVIDGQPPTVEIIAPQNGSVWNSSPDLIVTASDNASGISSVEYSIDNGDWYPMPMVDLATGKYAVKWQVTEADEGTHTIYFKASDLAGNKSVPVSTTLTVELCKPFDELTGVLNVTPELVYLSQDIVFDYTLTNSCSKSISGLTVRLQVKNPETGAVLADPVTTVNLSENEEVADSFTISSFDLGVGAYLADLQVSMVDKAASTVAEAVFEVIPALAVSNDSFDEANLLVWLNTAHDHKHKDDCKKRHDCGDDDDHKDEGLHDDDDDHKDKGHDEDHDHHGKSDNCRNDCKHHCAAIAMLEGILVDAVNSYQIVCERRDFEDELRNPLYSDILIIGDKHQLADHYADELREKVNSGSGLISFGWQVPGAGDRDDKRSGHHDYRESFLGIKAHGKLSGEDQVIETEDSMVTDVGFMHVAGKVWKVNAADDAKVAAWIAPRGHNSDDRHKDDDEQDHDYDDHQGCKDKHEKSKMVDLYPAIVLHEYGLGHTVYNVFDLCASLANPTYDQLADLLLRSLGYVHMERGLTEELSPYQITPFVLDVSSPAIDFELELNATCPAEIEIYDPKAGDWVTYPWTINTTVTAGGVAKIPYYVLAQDQVGDFVCSLAAGFVVGDQYFHLQDETFQFQVLKDISQHLDDIFAKLNQLPVAGKEKSKVKNALKYLKKVKSRSVLKSKYLEKNIHDILQAINSLLYISSTEIGDIRQLLDNLIRMEEGRYYYSVEDTDLDAENDD